MTCWYCGAPSGVSCAGCGARLCPADARYYVDSCNIAITNSARPKCPTCEPDRYPRPFTLARATERGEWEPAPTGRIASRRGVLGGFPCFDGTRIPYDTVLRLVDHDTITEHDVPEYFPRLTIDSWRVAAEYAVERHLEALDEADRMDE